MGRTARVNSGHATFCRCGFGAEGDTTAARCGLYIDSEPQLLRGIHGDGRVKRNGIPRVHRQRVEVDVLLENQRAGDVVSIVTAALIHHGFVHRCVFVRIETNAGERFVVEIRQIGDAITLHHADFIGPRRIPDEGMDDLRCPSQGLRIGVDRRRSPLDGDIMQVWRGNDQICRWQAGISAKSMLQWGRAWRYEITVACGC